jgi:hypothetical protein
MADPAQGPGSRFWPGHRVARVNSDFLKKSKWRRFSKKKTKVNGLQSSFWPSLSGSAGSCWVLTSSIFFKPDPIPVSGRPAGPGRAEFLNYVLYGYQCFGLCVARTCMACIIGWLVIFVWLRQKLDFVWLPSIFYTSRSWFFFFMKKESIIEGEIDVRQLANHAGYVSYCAMPWLVPCMI